MINTIIFDFGGVLVDWNPHHLYDPYFNDSKKTEFFLENICPYTWNTTVDAGKSTKEATEERVALHPEWEKEIRMYFGEWIKMMNGELPGMRELVKSYKDRGYRILGLTNWSAETFNLIRNVYPIFSLMDGIVVSGEEKTMKPLPEIYRILIERYSLNPEECVFIDDNATNLEGAEAFGIKGILFKSPEELSAQLEEVLQV